MSLAYGFANFHFLVQIVSYMEIFTLKRLRGSSKPEPHHGFEWDLSEAG